MEEDIQFLAIDYEVDKRTLFISDKVFDLFESTDSEAKQLFDIDPDVNYFNEINHHVSNTYNYCLEDTFRPKPALLPGVAGNPETRQLQSWEIIYMLSRFAFSAKIYTLWETSCPSWYFSLYVI